MNTNHGVEMASYMLENTSWPHLPHFSTTIVQLELGKAAYVIGKLAVTFEKINIADLSKFKLKLWVRKIIRLARCGHVL